MKIDADFTLISRAWEVLGKDWKFKCNIFIGRLMLLIGSLIFIFLNIHFLGRIQLLMTLQRVCINFDIMTWLKLYFLWALAIIYRWKKKELFRGNHVKNAPLVFQSIGRIAPISFRVEIAIGKAIHGWVVKITALSCMYVASFAGKNEDDTTNIGK